MAGATLVDSSREAIARRWTGASCRLRFQVEIRSGRDRDGWSKSGWIVAPPERRVRAGNTGAILRVSDRGLVVDGRLGPETGLLAEGWEVEGGLRLRLRFADRPGRAEMTFHGTFGRDLGAADLAEIERWARLDLFDLAAADEGVLEAAPPPPRPPMAGRESPMSPGLVLLGTGVEPLWAAPGTEVRLIATYEVRGVDAGSILMVEELRTVASAGSVLASFRATVERAPGTHRSSQTILLPADLAPGVLELRILLRAAGSEVAGRALLEVAMP